MHAPPRIGCRVSGPALHTVGALGPLPCQSAIARAAKIKSQRGRLQGGRKQIR
jgi:hypothetical protein